MILDIFLKLVLVLLLPGKVHPLGGVALSLREIVIHGDFESVLKTAVDAFQVNFLNSGFEEFILKLDTLLLPRMVSFRKGKFSNLAHFNYFLFINFISNLEITLFKRCGTLFKHCGTL